MLIEDKLPGCRFIQLASHADERGKLYPLDLRRVVGFDASRLFLVTLPEDPFGVQRGGHSNSTPEVLIAASGSVTIDLDAGEQKATVVLDRPDAALLIGPGVLIHLRDFAPKTLLVGLAEEPYSETEKFSEPQPSLFPVRMKTA